MSLLPWVPSRVRVLRRSQQPHPGFAQAGRVPPGILPWLQDSGSLTARLIEHFQAPLQVEILRHGRLRLDACEARLLAHQRIRYAYGREVCLKVTGLDRVYARSVWSERDQRGRLAPLKHLGERPLGGFLFSQTDLRRTQVEWTRIRLRTRHDAAIWAWARRSVFLLGEARVLVTEAFHPNIELH